MTAPHPTWFSRAYAWLGARTFFRWPSLVTEILSGLLLVGLLALVAALLHGWLALAVLATALSILFELRLDPNGWSLKDVAERELGIVLAVALLAVLT